MYRSPPRTREIQPSIPLQIPKIPFTPACAGNTLLRFRDVRYRTAYPYGAGNTGSSTAMTGAATEYLHAGGQHQNPDFLPGYISRLPPRTREIRIPVPVGIQGTPLTPAHAGNTGAGSFCHPLAAAHPRARGKYALGSLACSQSSPLAPAHAGNTGHCSPAWAVLTAHPRARGKYALAHNRMLTPEPLTPAHAGNTSGNHGYFKGHSAHPRARGKYGLIPLFCSIVTRSPPRTREIPLPAAYAPRTLPLTPAHAGNTHRY